MPTWTPLEKSLFLTRLQEIGGNADIEPMIEESSHWQFPGDAAMNAKTITESSPTAEN
jgi:hypothetical protein